MQSNKEGMIMLATKARPEEPTTRKPLLSATPISRDKVAPRTSDQRSDRSLSGQDVQADRGDAPTIRPARLRFAQDALEPHVSAETMHHHYDKHYLGYVDRTNALIKGSDLAASPLEDVVRQAAWKRRRALLVNASQAWNHAFFWASLSPDGKQGPDTILASALEKSFGSLGNFRQKFIEKGMAHVGSGWLWLVWDKDRGLMLVTTDKTIPVWLATDRTPLLVCDLWEHAYYLDWKHDRAGWLTAFIDNCANWQTAGKQLASLVKGMPTWKYPG